MYVHLHLIMLSPFYIEKKYIYLQCTHCSIGSTFFSISPISLSPPLSITLLIKSSARLPNLLNLLFSQFHIRLPADIFTTGPYCNLAYGFYTVNPLLSYLDIIRFIDIFYYEKNIYKHLLQFSLHLSINYISV